MYEIIGQNHNIIIQKITLKFREKMAYFIVLNSMSGTTYFKLSQT